MVDQLHPDEQAPPPDQRIRQLHAWIATFPDNSEGIIAGGFQGLGMAPLVSSSRDIAEKMEPMAIRARQANLVGAGRIVSVRLVTFTSTEEPR